MLASTPPATRRPRLSVRLCSRGSASVRPGVLVLPLALLLPEPSEHGSGGRDLSWQARPLTRRCRGRPSVTARVVPRMFRILSFARALTVAVFADFCRGFCGAAVLECSWSQQWAGAPSTWAAASSTWPALEYWPWRSGGGQAAKRRTRPWPGLSTVRQADGVLPGPTPQIKRQTRSAATPERAMPPGRAAASLAKAPVSWLPGPPR